MIMTDRKRKTFISNRNRRDINVKERQKERNGKRGSHI